MSNYYNCKKCLNCVIILCFNVLSFLVLTTHMGMELLDNRMGVFESVQCGKD